LGIVRVPTGDVEQMDDRLVGDTDSGGGEALSNKAAEASSAIGPRGKTLALLYGGELP
jgi:hypothetical protein